MSVLVPHVIMCHDRIQLLCEQLPMAVYRLQELHQRSSEPGAYASALQFVHSLVKTFCALWGQQHFFNQANIVGLA